MTTFNRKLALAAILAVAGFAGAAQAQPSSAYSTAHNELEQASVQVLRSSAYDANAKLVGDETASPSSAYSTGNNELGATGYRAVTGNSAVNRQADVEVVSDAAMRDSAWRN